MVNVSTPRPQTPPSSSTQVPATANQVDSFFLRTYDVQPSHVFVSPAEFGLKVPVSVPGRSI
ncbi:unnamed protein product [Prunus armeniaca]